MKRKKRKYTVLYDDAKSLAKAFLWIAIVIMLLYLIGRYIYGTTDKEGNRLVVGSYSELVDVKIPKGVTNEELRYYGFTSYFNPALHVPNCVSYELLGSETVGDVQRKNSFVADYAVDGCAESADYRNSGYDRGHMAPAADMKWNETAMEQSFYMTNVCPQVKRLNSGIWHRLEKKIRDWALRDSALIVVCGPIFDSDNPQTIGDIKVAVPDRFFKVVYSPRLESSIGFIFENDNVKGELRKFAVPVDSVEAVTGFDFFYNLPDEVETRIESECNYKLWEKR